LPERGGHSISKVLLVIAEASRSCSTAQASITLPPEIVAGSRATKSPSIAWPVSSWNSRSAARSGFSSGSISPLGIDQAPSSLFFQNGPPGWTRNSSGSSRQR